MKATLSLNLNARPSILESLCLNLLWDIILPNPEERTESFRLVGCTIKYTGESPFMEKMAMAFRERIWNNDDFPEKCTENAVQTFMVFVESEGGSSFQEYLTRFMDSKVISINVAPL